VLSLLGSANPDQILSAAAAAERMRQAAGATWHEIVQPPPPMAQPTSGTEIEDDLDLILDKLAELSGWEANFARSVASRSIFSEKQIGIIQRIARKLRRAAKAAA
jgi:hypothetical protein